MKLTNEDAYDVIRIAADRCGGDLRDDYSGRGMFGERCVGIVCDNPDEAIEEAASQGLKGARTDSMGRQAIVYWPSVKPL